MMDQRSRLDDIREFVEHIATRARNDEVKIPVTQFGAINVRSRQRIAEVPFLYPTLVLVIRGKKGIYYHNTEQEFSSGDYLAIPAPSNVDVINEPVDAYTSFLALYLQFDLSLVERFCRLYQIEVKERVETSSFRLESNQVLDSAVCHYLELENHPNVSAEILEHRLMEILLCLVNDCNAGHMLLSMSPKWSERVYSLMLSNPSEIWLIKDVCRLLNISESTLRRNLRSENTSFRKILDDIRMGQALSEVQFSPLPISMIAENCGYSSFTIYFSVSSAF